MQAGRALSGQKSGDAGVGDRVFTGPANDDTQAAAVGANLCRSDGPKPMPSEQVFEGDKRPVQEVTVPHRVDETVLNDRQQVEELAYKHTVGVHLLDQPRDRSVGVHLVHEVVNVGNNERASVSDGGEPSRPERREPGASVSAVEFADGCPGRYALQR